jgi:uncharacterized protein YndB with AHSA1/START domain
MTQVDHAAALKCLRMRKVIPASPERVFRAWTDPDELKQWWGPKGVRCTSAEIDLEVGGKYRIANELPDGAILWISGIFEVIEKPNLLTFTWVVENGAPNVERVSVQFEPHELGTQVTLTHELISTAALRDQHQNGWIGCLDGLHDYSSES